VSATRERRPASQPRQAVVGEAAAAAARYSERERARVAAATIASFFSEGRRDKRVKRAKREGGAQAFFFEKGLSSMRYALPSECTVGVPSTRRQIGGMAAAS